VPRSQTVTPPVAPRATVTIPASRTNPPEIAPSPIRAPEQPPVQPAEQKLTAPVEPGGTAPVEQMRAAPVEEPEPEVQHVFIDGILVPAPLASELSHEPAMSPGSDRVSTSSVVVGALLLLIPVLFYLAAS
jgi:hypothetical protein